jgi:hypothetical protein
MLKASLLTLSAVFVSAAATASPTSQATSSAAPREVQVADATQPSSAATSTPAAPAMAVAPKKICKQLPSSYSHTTQRVCLTKEEWKQVDEQSRD